MERKIEEELEAGHYVFVSQRPRIVSALTTVPKGDNDIRLIHDLSRPECGGVNYFATKEAFKYQSLSDALNLIKPCSYMAKVDLKAAYRSVHINPQQHTLTGLKWKFKSDMEPTYMIDTRLPFGARKSPFVFNRITQSIKRMMSRKGFSNIVVYLDDFFICADSFDECLHAYTTLVYLLRGLGFDINWDKVVDPCECLCFLGVIIDTVQGTLSLPNSKTKEIAHAFHAKTRASKKQLQHLAGKLCWAAQVTPWGRAHIRSIFDAIASLKKPDHKCKLQLIKEDLKWWTFCLTQGTNVRRIWTPVATLDVYTDACSAAGGAFCCGNWIYINWSIDNPSLSQQHINVKELAAVISAARAWAQSWKLHHIIIHTDNSVTEACINNGTARNKTGLVLLKELAELAMQYNFTISAIYLPGKENTIADTISRLHEPGMICKLRSLLGLPCISIVTGYHMSHKSQKPIFQVLSWESSRSFT